MGDGGLFPLPVVRWAVSEVGYDDCNIMADTRDGRYVVKIFHTSRSPALCARYVDVVRRVTEAGVAHPRLHRAEGSALLHHRPTGNRLMVMDRVEGTTFLDADACPDDTELASVVEQTYRIHALDLYPEYVHDWWAIPQIATLAAEVAHLLTPGDQDRVAAAVETFGRLRVGTLPQVFSHGDLTKANLLRTPAASRPSWTSPSPTATRVSTTSRCSPSTCCTARPARSPNGSPC
ncbi:aminoglycoside phosphotransferase family protein [Streptomyces sp. AD16]|nr:aminoglycoside phosphotransferase family protein [Streptomyces sp. AD16]